MAWGSFSDPAAPNVFPPSAIIWPPTAWLTSISTKPVRIAHAKLGAASSRKNDRTVTNTLANPISAPSMPIQENTVSSNVVDSLKWDSTPRHFCIEMRKTSPSEATPSTVTTTHPVTFLARKKVRNQVSVRTVIPNESPNTTGLRHETGPSQDPPSTRNTPKCTRPLVSRIAAHA